MSVQSSRADAATTQGMLDARETGRATRQIQTMVRLTAMIGGPLFLITVILHPARDGDDIAAHPQWYSFTHSFEAISLLVLSTCLAGVLALALHRPAPRGLATLYTALVGTMLWFGLIIYDGGHNPVTAAYAPGLVHTPDDVDVMGGIIVLTANIVFPLGYVLLALLLSRHGQRLTGLLLGFGGVVYAIGGTTALFALGPHSVITSVLEIIGAAPFALGFLNLGRTTGRSESATGEPNA